MPALLQTWRGRFIAVFVLVQLLVPLHYYLRHRDPHDERFAWRMFSPMRTATCVPQFTLGTAPVDLGREFHEAWGEIAKRGRFTVVEAMGARLCAKYPTQKLRVTLTCAYLDRPTETFGGYDMCSVPEL